MKDTIIRLLADVMEQDMNNFNDDTVISEISEFDSLKFVMMISELQEKYGINIPLDKALEVATIGELVECAVKCQ